MKNKKIFALGLSALLSIVLVAGCKENKKAEANPPKPVEVKKEIVVKPELPKVDIVDKRIKWNQDRENLMREYAKTHYGLDTINIVPKVIVEHWTASGTWESCYNHFYNVSMEDDGGGRLNVASHFLVARDGTIFRLTEETALNRHSIGYNHCAIGIENVGGVDGREDLTKEQLEANIKLIRYWKAKYPTIEYVWGHYQQNEAKASGLHIEKVPDYYAGKPDPGPKFMRGLREALADTDIKFYKE